MTSETICALCPEVLSIANQTKEHIIPQSIGGREKITNFICVKCNSEKGETWDAALAKQFNWFSVMTDIVRERNAPPAELVKTVSGAEYLLQQGGHMVPAKFSYKQVEKGEGMEISFIARTTNEAAKKINELAKRHLSFDRDRALSAVQMKTTYLQEPLVIDASFGGEAVSRSVVKTALAFAVSKGITASSCSDVRNFLRDEAVPASFHGLCYLKDLISLRPSQTIFHCVSLRADSATRRLMAYVEYFSFARWLVLLSSEYDGADIYETYAIDPTTGQPIDLNVNWELTEQEVEATVSGYGLHDGTFPAAVDSTLGEIMRRDRIRGHNNALNEAFERTRTRFGIKIGSSIPVHLAKPFASAFVEEIAPYILHVNGIKADSN